MGFPRWNSAGCQNRAGLKAANESKEAHIGQMVDTCFSFVYMISRLHFSEMRIELCMQLPHFVRRFHGMAIHEHVAKAALEGDFQHQLYHRKGKKPEYLHLGR